MPHETIDSISRTRVALKGPLETPVGFGEKSANVTLRKLFETYANVRPVREMPGVKTPYCGRGIDLVMVRENVEDLYAGIEYMQTPGVAQALKLISVKGSEKIARFAFEYARSEGRTQGRVRDEGQHHEVLRGHAEARVRTVAPDYPEIESWHVIVDNAAHQLVKRPEQFEVIVTTNMNGDILSDLSSALIGGLGFAPSANIGNEVAIFEAVHGSAPEVRGQERDQPDRGDPVGGADAALPRAVRAGGGDRARGLRHARVGRADRRRARATTAGRPTTDYTDAIIGNLGKRTETWTIREVKPLKLPEARSRARLRAGRARAPSSAWTSSWSPRCRRPSWARR